MKANVTDLLGKVFGRLTVISFHEVRHIRGRKKSYWLCKCICGNTVSVVRGSLLHKVEPTRSCGCLHREVTSLAKSKHRESSITGNTKEYRTWAKMIARCTNQNDPKYHRYGGRGITVCERWRHSYDNFLSDLGRAPSKKHSIDRINVNGNYEPGNCRWATAKQQANNTTKNRYISYLGITKSASDWALEVGMKQATIIARLNRGWSVYDTLNKPVLSNTSA